MAAADRRRPVKLAGFKVLTFDCYGTLIDWETGIYGALKAWLDRERLEASRERVLAAFADIEPRIEARMPTALYRDILGEVFGELALELGGTCTADDAARFAGSVGDWPAFPDTGESLRYLESHYKLVVLSNIDNASFTATLPRLGVEFEAVFTAEDIGSYKPDRRNFAYMIDRLSAMGFAKGDILHTAQSLYHDHVPAREMGLATCWIDRRHGIAGAGATKRPETDVNPDLYATSLADLVTLHGKEATDSTG